MRNSLTTDGGGADHPVPFTDREYEQFSTAVQRDPWVVSREDATLYDISITNPEVNREIRINSARDRVSYRATDREEWGLRQKPVSDLETVVVRLMTVAPFVPLHEMQYLGLEDHPAPPEDPGFAYDEHDETDDDLTGV